MNPAILFLLRRSLVNGLRTKLLRLKSPRYLIPTLVGVGYFVFLFGSGFMGEGGGRGPSIQGGPADRRFALFLEWGMTLGLLLLASLSWILPSKGPPLAFLESDVEMLFPSPLSRRELVHYKLLDMQKYYVPMVVIFSLLYGVRDGPAAVIRIVVGGFLALNLISLHGVGAKLTRQSLLDHGVSGWKSRLPFLAVLGLLAAVVAFGSPAMPVFDGARKEMDVLASWLEEFGRSPGGLVLFPLRTPARMFLSPDLPSFLLNAVPVLLLAGLLLLWVTRTDAAFEESAAEQAKVLASRMAAARKGRLGRTVEPGTKVRRSPLRLAPTGPPETAFVWRSFTETLRHVSPRFLLVIGMLLVGLLPVVLSVGTKEKGVPVFPMIVSALSLVFSGLLVFGGPAFLGCNLRQDMEMTETLKTLPIPGARFFRASLAGAVAPSAVLALVLILVAAILFPSTPKLAVTPGWRLAGFTVLGLVIPSLMALSALVDAGAALLFPGWVRPGQAQAQGGMEGMGYGIVTIMAKFLLLGLGGGIPLAIGAGLGFAVGAVGGDLFLPAGAMIGGAAAAACILGEVWFASEMLGGRWERLDPSEEGLLPG